MGMAALAAACSPAQPTYFDDTISGPLEIEVVELNARVDGDSVRVSGMVRTVTPPGDMPGVPIALVDETSGMVLDGVLSREGGAFDLVAFYTAEGSVSLRVTDGPYRPWSMRVTDILND